MKRSNKYGITTALLCLLLGFAGPSPGQPPKMKMTTDIPASITTPDKVKTRIGTLEFFDGFPTEATAQKCFDNLDFMRGVEAFMYGLPGASLVAMRAGVRELGAVNGTIGITETLMDSKSLFLTPNTESIYTGRSVELNMLNFFFCCLEKNYLSIHTTL